MKTRFYSYVSVGGAFLLLTGCFNQDDKSYRLPKCANADKPRNVIFILSDDHRYDFMGFTGAQPWLKTPGMDRMAREGAYLQNAFVTTSLSSPSRASILTGLYSHCHTVVDNQAPLPQGLTFFPQYLQAAGYNTAFFGKWHMGDTGDAPQPGFSHWESFEGQGVYYNPTLNINGERVSFGDSTYVTDLLTEHAIDWMKKQSKEKPFFVYLSHKGVHAEFSPAKRHKGIYKDVDVNEPANVQTPYYNITTPPTKDKEGIAKSGRGFYGEEFKPDWVKHQRESWHGIDYAYHNNTSYKDLVKDYCETLQSVDESISSVLDYLKEAGLDESTLVIYMGDNGFCWGEHGLIDKRHFYEASVRVPMLAYCPELIKPGTVVTKMIQNIDIAPTVLEAAGLQSPESFSGKSFIPLLQQKETEWRDKIFYEYYWEYAFPQTPTMHGVRTDRYKYIRYHGIWDTNEFYDLQNDPNELHNLIDAPEHQETIKELVASLYDWLEETDGMQIPLKRTMQPKGDHRNRGNR